MTPRLLIMASPGPRPHMWAGLGLSSYKLLICFWETPTRCIERPGKSVTLQRLAGRVSAVRSQSRDVRTETYGSMWFWSGVWTFPLGDVINKSVAGGWILPQSPAKESGCIRRVGFGTYCFCGSLVSF